MKKLGQIRRSQVISGNGPGAIIDFRSPDGAPVSAVAAGLEKWDEFSIKRGLMNRQVVRHAALEATLEVGGFRLPPVGEERSSKKKQPTMLPAYRFPDWHVCPKCHLLQRTRSWGSDGEKPDLYCPHCSTGRGRSKKKVFVTPVSFVVTCAAGHLQDFPWQEWPEHEAGCAKRSLRLVGEGAGLKGLRVRCGDCGAARDLDGVLSPSALQGKIGCFGARPWLGDREEGCGHPPVAIQRNASNAYFPVVLSALDVPSYGDALMEQIEDYWDRLKALKEPDQIRSFVQAEIHPKWPVPGVSAEALAARILKLLRQEAADLRENEYLVLASEEEADVGTLDFQTRRQIPPENFAAEISRLVCVERLREVRALCGFTRLSPAVGAEEDEARIARLSRQKLNWLPAAEVRGEGIFLGFSPEKIAEWEERPAVKTRAAAAMAAAERGWRAHHPAEVPFPLTITARLLLIHTTAHALADRLSLDCGYSTASIRERLYVSSGAEGMCGFLLYTSTPDADGTLGGLSRIGRPRNLAPIFEAAIRDLEWCSSDPLCGDGVSSLSEGSGLAACHCCVFLPETSCEHFNRHLDRAMLVGTPKEPKIGYFRRIFESF